MLAPSSSSCSVSLVCAIPLGVWLRMEEIAWKSHQPISNSLLNCRFRLREFVLSLQLWNNNSVFHRELVLPGQKALVAPLGTFPRFGLDFPLRLSEEAFSSVETSVAHCWLPLLSCRLPGASLAGSNFVCWTPELRRNTNQLVERSDAPQLCYAQAPQDVQLPCN